jgi:integrase/recombinase XerC
MQHSSPTAAVFADAGAITQNPFGQIDTQLDLIAELLADKRSANTRRAYARDLADFFQSVAGAAPNPAIVQSFLQLSRFNAIALVLKYKASLIDKGLKEATVNRRLAAIKALANHARKLGIVDWTLADIKSEKIKPYRDTSGITAESFKRVLAVPNRDTLKGKRDYALLRLLWDNALRRSEVAQADIKDLDLEGRKLWILGKGRGSQKEAISLSRATVQALQEWLQARQELDINQPLFIALDRASCGHGLTGTAIYKIVQASAKAAGIAKHISPHRIRHSGITAALDASGGDVRRVQKLSRHANLNTLMIYDDNRRNHQAEITELLAGLV